MLNNLPWQDQASQPRLTNPNKINKRNAVSTISLNAVNNLIPHNALRAFSFAKKTKMATDLASTTTEWENFFAELMNLIERLRIVLTANGKRKIPVYVFLKKMSA